MLEWHALTTSAELQALTRKSHDTPAVILKHSTRCGASAVVKRRLEEDWDIEAGAAHAHLLDLIGHRDVSDEVAETFGVQHESPQVLIIKDGRSIFDASHGDVSVAAIKRALESM